MQATPERDRALQELLALATGLKQIQGCAIIANLTFDSAAIASAIHQVATELQELRQQQPSWLPAAPKSLGPNDFFDDGPPLF